MARPKNNENLCTITKLVETRFWNKVHIYKDGCWNWTGAVWSSGYGQFYIDGSMYGAHRVSWIINHGLIPDGKLVLHKCDNRLCVNPDHIYIGNYSNNISDRATRSPHLQGNGNGMTSMFYGGEIWLIKRLCKAGYTRRYVAKMFKCSHSQINKIVHNEFRWPKRLDHTVGGL